LEFDFADGPLGLIGNGVQYLDADEALVLTVDAFYWNGSSWSSSGNIDLYRRRDEPNDHGLGVCNPNEQSSTECAPPVGTGGGDINELDNSGTPELIRLHKEDPWEWVSLGLSSLDGNDSSNSANWERGILWGSDSGSLSGVNSDLSNYGGTILEMFVWDGIYPEPDLDLEALDYDYLFFQPIDWSFDLAPLTTFSGGHKKKKKTENFNNDFLIRGAVLTEPDRDVPEPSSLFLLVVGGAALAARARRRCRT
jgi:hypothetical protein